MYIVKIPTRWDVHNALWCTELSCLKAKVKPCTDIVTNLLAIGLRLDVRIACDGLQQKFQHAEHSTCDPLIFQPIFSFHMIAHM